MSNKNPFPTNHDETSSAGYPDPFGDGSIARYLKEKSMSPKNPFLPDDPNDTTFLDPFGPGAAERFRKEHPEPWKSCEVFTDGCPVCWTKSGFKTKFVAGSPENKLCDWCAPEKCDWPSADDDSSDP